MSRVESNWHWSTRHPRYPAAVEEGRCTAQVVMRYSNGDETRNGKMGDISMTGIQLFTDFLCDRNEAIEIEIVTKDGTNVSRKCSVRRCETIAEQTFMLGCEFSTPLTYEELGELFLSNTIDQDLPD